MRRLALIFMVFLSLAIGWRIIGSRAYYSEMGINLVVVGDNSVAIVGVSRVEESLVWVELPSNLRMDGYPAVSVWGLGEIEGDSEEVVVKTLGEGLGLWLQGAVKVDDRATVEGLLSRLLSLKGIKGLSWLDRYTLYKDVLGLTSKGIVLETSLPQQVLDKVQDVDGYEWVELNEAVFVWSRDLWPKEDVVNLGSKMEVINVSDVPGLARIRARQLESVGFRVVRVEAGEMKIDGSCLMRLKSNGLLKQLAENYLGCDVEIINLPLPMDQIFVRED